jgi:galactose-1-phosphate uridylyltransferase
MDRPRAVPRSALLAECRSTHSFDDHPRGSETLAGAFINDVRPEEAAERLRRAPGRSPR